MFDIEEDKKICEKAKNQKLYTVNKYITPNGANFICDALAGWPRALNEIERLQAGITELQRTSSSLTRDNFELSEDFDAFYKEKIEQLQKENEKLEQQLNETYTDENGTVWTRPTAWSYAQICKANTLLHRKIDEIECLKESEET